ADFGDEGGDLGGFRHFIERDHGIAVDGRLAGEHRASVCSPLIVDGARDHGDAAGLALAGTAVVRNDHPAAETGVDQGFTDTRGDRLAVDDELTCVGHGRELDGQWDWKAGMRGPRIGLRGALRRVRTMSAMRQSRDGPRQSLCPTTNLTRKVKLW